MQKQLPKLFAHMHNQVANNHTEHAMQITPCTISTAQELDATMGRYAGHSETARNLAELLHAVPGDAAPWVKDTLRECAKMYAKKHGIKKGELRAAAKDYATWARGFDELSARGLVQ